MINADLKYIRQALFHIVTFLVCHCPEMKKLPGKCPDCDGAFNGLTEMTEQWMMDIEEEKDRRKRPHLYPPYPPELSHPPEPPREDES